MTATALMTRPLTLVYREPDSVDQYNQPVYEETDVESRGYVSLVKAGVDPAVARFTDTLAAYLPPETVTTNLARVQVDGLDFDIDGAPFGQVNPRTGLVEYVVVPLRKAA